MWPSPNIISAVSPFMITSFYFDKNIPFLLVGNLYWKFGTVHRYIQYSKMMVMSKSENVTGMINLSTPTPLELVVRLHKERILQ